ncbi:DUF7793 family protein [Pseudarthrobacter sp. MDT3-1]
MGSRTNTEGHRVRRTPLEGGKGSVELRGDGIVHLIWTPHATIDVADARAAMAMVNEVCNGVDHPMLVDMAATETVSREARAVWSIPCAASRIALLGSSPVDRVVANFFLGINAPHAPTKFFTYRSEAMSWLLGDTAH